MITPTVMKYLLFVLFLDDKFRVGWEIDIKLDIKPRNISGLLVSVHAKKDYLVLQMINGQIKFSVDNGKGEISTAYNPPIPHYFCDGEWHNIQGTFNHQLNIIYYKVYMSYVTLFTVFILRCKSN